LPRSPRPLPPIRSSPNPRPKPTRLHFQPLGQALTALGGAESYALDVESKWGAADAAQAADAPGGSSRYKLTAQRGKYRVEVQSAAAQSPELICACDGTNVTTFFPARKLYSQHAVGSPQASIESNTMLAISLQGSAIDIMLQPDVAGFVRTQATDVHDHGQELLGKVKADHFELFWAGAKVELWFAAEGEPLLLQFTRTTCVPTADNDNYEQVCTAKFNWKLGAAPPEGAFAIELPKDARRVNEIYDALSGEEPAARVGKPLPKIPLTMLDGSSLELAAAKDQRATVLIFWATCASTVKSRRDQWSRRTRTRGLHSMPSTSASSPARCAASWLRARWQARSCSTRAEGHRARSA
jgi:hypothetical protein